MYEQTFFADFLLNTVDCIKLKYDFECPINLQKERLIRKGTVSRAGDFLFLVLLNLRLSNARIG
jgi:hypothetical protein